MSVPEKVFVITLHVAASRDGRGRIVLLENVEIALEENVKEDFVSVKLAGKELPVTGKPPVMKSATALHQFREGA